MNKTFIWSQLDYADVISDQAYNSCFHEDVKFSQYNSYFYNNKSDMRYVIWKTLPRFGPWTLQTRL